MVEVKNTAPQTQTVGIKELPLDDYMKVHDAAVAEYERSTSRSTPYSAAALRRAVDAAFHTFSTLSPSPTPNLVGGDDDHMTKIDDLISQLQGIRSKFGNTCVYIRRGGMGWGAVALNRRDDDKKNGVFDLQAQHDRDMLARLEQIERLKAERDELRAALAATATEDSSND